MTGLWTKLDGPARLICVLGLLAAVLSVGAVIAVLSQARQEKNPFVPQTMFPGLEGRLESVAGLDLVTSDETIRVRRQADGQWVLPDRAGYPARPDPLIGTVVGLADLEIVEPKTANPARHDLLALEDPAEGGEGVRLALYDDQETEMAALILGDEPLLGDIGGRRAIYVRRPGEAQTWLANADIDLVTGLSDWLASGFLSVPRERMTEISVTPTEGDAYKIVRDEDAPDGFTVSPLGENERLSNAFTLGTMAGALATFPISDVSPVSEIDFSDAARTVYQTTDGLEITLDALAGAQVNWVRLSARAVPVAADGARAVDPEVAREAEALAARIDGWAFQVAGFKIDQFTRPRSALVEIAEPAATIDEAPALQFDPDEVKGTETGGEAPDKSAPEGQAP